MATQDFTAGQVLTAAQMDTLQTNDYNWTKNTKTANYTLVAADKGTTIFCNSASPITITLPPSVFADGDEINIYNQNSGVVTIATAFGATFAKSGNTNTTSATLRQYAGGVVRWTSTSGAAWLPTYNNYVDGCETGSIVGAVISAPTNYTVTFAAGRFNVAPIVTASTYGGQPATLTFASDPQATTTGFTITVTPITAAIIARVNWIAIQQGTN